MDTIAILIPSLKKGGAEKQAVLLKNALSDHYHVYFILFNAELGHEQELIELGHLDDDHLVKLQGSLSVNCGICIKSFASTKSGHFLPISPPQISLEV